MLNKITTALLVSSCSLPAFAGVTQIGEFRIGASDFTSDTFVDPGVVAADDIETRAVGAAPVQVNSLFTATSQEAGLNGATADDLTLRTFSSLTRLRTLNRFTPDPDGVGGVQRAGGAQFSFDLSPLDSYLSENALSLTELDLDLALATSDDNATYNVQLSYTSASAGTTLTGIGADGASVYTTFVLPTLGASDGDFINGQFEVIAAATSGDQTLSDSLLGLYEEGVRDFNLVITSSAFLNGRNIDIIDGSGLSITTTPIPEPASLALVGLGAVAMLRRRR